jgi:hypothetical protein
MTVSKKRRAGSPAVFQSFRHIEHLIPSLSGPMLLAHSLFDEFNSENRSDVFWCFAHKLVDIDVTAIRVGFEPNIKTFKAVERQRIRYWAKIRGCIQAFIELYEAWNRPDEAEK